MFEHMASQQKTADYILEQIALAGTVSARKMFGEYGLYCDGKMVALVCDDQLFVKPTEAGRAHVGEVREASPYPGAKPCFLIPGDLWDDADWLAGLIRITTAELPAPIKKRKSKVNSRRR
jgi:TfoX/Sxy family transcriptional regulator of competence genes